MRISQRVRKMGRTILVAGVLTAVLVGDTLAQSSQPESTIVELQRQLDEMRSQMAAMQNRIAELEAHKGSAETRSSPDVPRTRSDPPSAQSVSSKADAATSPAEPTSFHYKGLTVTPGGFLEGTMLVRARNENADIANSFSAIPLNGSSNALLSEFRGTARNSEFSLLLEGTTGHATLKGYVEADFLGAAPTANYVESNSWTPRLRQLWIQFEWPSGWAVISGQTWSLLTSNEQGIAPLKELRPPTQDGQYVVGFSWARQRALRFTKNFNDKVWTAFAIETPETTYSAAFVPANVMGLNTSQNAQTGVNLLPFLVNYSDGFATSFLPDLLGKVAVEPGWGHFEIKGLGRVFRDRIASTATTSGQTNVTAGYGIGFGALMPFANKAVTVSLEGIAGA